MNEYIVNAFTRENDKTNLEVDNLNVSCITSKNNNFELDNSGNLTVKNISVESGLITSQAVLNLVYPIGSIYMSINNSDPNTLFGGKWEQIKDKFLLACGDTYTNGTTGGEDSHILTINELPSHTHTISSSGGHNHDARFKEHYIGTDTTGAYDYARSYSQSYDYIKRVTTTTGEHTHALSNTGGGQAHNNMPPYLTIYVWKRIQ